MAREMASKIVWNEFYYKMPFSDPDSEYYVPKWQFKNHWEMDRLITKQKREILWSYDPSYNDLVEAVT